MCQRCEYLWACLYTNLDALEKVDFLLCFTFQIGDSYGSEI